MRRELWDIPAGVTKEDHCQKLDEETEAPVMVGDNSMPKMIQESLKRPPLRSTWQKKVNSRAEIV